MSKPVVIDLCCGLGGWSKAFIEEGWDAIGFDIEKHEYGDKRYPGHLILKDIREINGHDLRAAVNPALIVASPPCQEYSYMAMPWKRAKQIAAEYRSGVRDVKKLTELYRACFRIARECGVPIVLENVKGAQPWVGRAAWHYGSYYLWGDVPALMPMTLKAVKVGAHAMQRDGHAHTPHLTHRAEHDQMKNAGNGSWFGIGSPGQTQTTGNPVNGTKAETAGNGTAYGGDFGWDGSAMRQGNSKSNARKAASAMIAEIPFDLAQWIAKVFKP